MSDHPPIALTEGRTFCTPDEHAMLAVNANVPASDALEFATSLLGGATRMMLNSSDYAEDSVVIQYLLESSKTLMEASLSGLWTAEKLAFRAR